ncbi:MAG: peptidylprolyl isomerase [Clostridiaceae bacterium]|nr:peptidylprolyl isomerase [Clostridiaceae bacterium]
MSKETVNIKMTMSDQSSMTLELYPDIAPETVENFLKLVNDNFYDGLIFHRVIEGFMIQGGCPDGTGMGGPGWAIKGEFSMNGFDNPLKHDRGVISMARAMDPNSAGSQFFIMHANSPHLDGQYAAFGKLIEGMDTLDKIATVATDFQDKPLEEQKIESIRVID